MLAAFKVVNPAPLPENDVAVRVPEMAGAVFNTTLPVPVLVVVPVPPCTTAKVPVVTLAAFREFNAAPLPKNEVAVRVPEMVGAVLNTTLPDPVLVAVPVPPRATPKVPVVTLAAFKVVKPAPDTPANRSEGSTPLITLAAFKSVSPAPLPEKKSALRVSEMMGAVFNTTLPVPVLVVVPVPPLATTRVPVVTFAAFRELNASPFPLKVIASMLFPTSVWEKTALPKT
jgi:hypothetical protein